MKRLLGAGILATALALSLTACPANWLAQFEANPAGEISAASNDIDTMVTIATAIVNQILPTLSTAQQAQAYPIWNAALVEMGNAKTLLSDAVQVAQATQDASLGSLPTIVAAVGNAVIDLANAVASIEALAQSSTTGAKLTTIKGDAEFQSAITHAKYSVAQLQKVKH
jgi:hypothetical protein